MAMRIWCGRDDISIMWWSVTSGRSTTPIAEYKASSWRQAAIVAGKRVNLYRFIREDPHCLFLVNSISRPGGHMLKC